MSSVERLQRAAQAHGQAVSERSHGRDATTTTSSFTQHEYCAPLHTPLTSSEASQAVSPLLRQLTPAAAAAAVGRGDGWLCSWKRAPAAAAATAAAAAHDTNPALTSSNHCAAAAAAAATTPLLSLTDVSRKRAAAQKFSRQRLDAKEPVLVHQCVVTKSQVAYSGQICRETRDTNVIRKLTQKQ